MAAWTLWRPRNGQTCQTDPVMKLLASGVLGIALTITSCSSSQSVPDDGSASSAVGCVDTNLCTPADFEAALVEGTPCSVLFSIRNSAKDDADSASQDKMNAGLRSVDCTANSDDLAKSPQPTAAVGAASAACLDAVEALAQARIETDSAPAELERESLTTCLTAAAWVDAVRENYEGWFLNDASAIGDGSFELDDACGTDMLDTPVCVDAANQGLI